MTVTNTFTIEITDEQIERAIARSTTKVYYQGEDEEPREDVMDLGALVTKAVNQRIDKAVDKVTKEVIEDTVAERVRDALDAGFPTFDEWGSPKGRKTLADLIGERVFKPDRNSNRDPLYTMCREHAEKTVKAMVAEAVKKVSVDLDAMFKEAAAEGIAAVLMRKLGVS